jgi:hypothetical protein
MSTAHGKRSYLAGRVLAYLYRARPEKILAGLPLSFQLLLIILVTKE